MAKSREVGNYRVIKLDRRYNGANHFRWAVDPGPVALTLNRYASAKNTDFIRLRIWCWEQWGPSAELSCATSMRELNQGEQLKWAWDSEDIKNHVRRIFLKGDEELSFFILAWSGGHDLQSPY